jgi:hypothetical protein
MLVRAHHPVVVHPTEEEEAVNERQRSDCLARRSNACLRGRDCGGVGMTAPNSPTTTEALPVLKLDEEALEKARVAVADEWGSRLCFRDALTRRNCVKLSGKMPCVCAEVSQAAIRAYEASKTVTEPRPLSEWHEDMGPMLWWKFPVTEAPYVGSPLDCGFAISVEVNGERVGLKDVGGWPGYHTHFTPIPLASEPLTAARLSPHSTEDKE